MNYDPIWNENFLSPDTIALEPEQIEQAIALSESAGSEAQQWQQYLNAIAQAGMREWLQKRAPELPLQLSSDLISFQVNQFRLLLLARDGLHNEIAVPIVTQPIHFYVLVEVLEELEQVCVRGFLRPQQVLDRCAASQPDSTASPTASPTASYFVPIEQFDLNPDRLLLSLRCLDASTLPEAVVAASVSAQPEAIASSLTQGAINLKLWLSDRLDQVAQELSWILLPAAPPSLALRSMRLAVDEFNQVLTQLTEQRRINPPPQARTSYQDFRWEGAALRLYAMTWQVGTDWSLLLVLGAQPGYSLPIGTRLQVRDAEQVLANLLLQDRSQDYLFTQVIGTGAECFWASIGAQNGMTLSLPPFTFVDEPGA